MDHAAASRARACVARQTDALIEQTFTRFVADMTAKEATGAPARQRSGDRPQEDSARIAQNAMMRFQGSVSILFSLEASAKRLIDALTSDRSGSATAQRSSPMKEDAMGEAFRPDPEPNGGTSW